MHVCPNTYANSRDRCAAFETTHSIFIHIFLYLYLIECGSMEQSLMFTQICTFDENFRELWSRYEGRKDCYLNLPRYKFMESIMTTTVCEPIFLSLLWVFFLFTRGAMDNIQGWLRVGALSYGIICIHVEASKVATMCVCVWGGQSVADPGGRAKGAVKISRKKDGCSCL